MSCWIHAPGIARTTASNWNDAALGAILLEWLAAAFADSCGRRFQQKGRPDRAWPCRRVGARRMRSVGAVLPMKGRADMVDVRFLDDVASADPTPGGGGAAAYCGALAAALAAMVGNLTVGKKTYASVECDVRASLARLSELRARLAALVDEDARAFEPLAAAYRMPNDTPERAAAKDDALQHALVLACEVPLRIMENVALVVDEADFLAHNGSRMVRSDAGVAAAFARAAIEGASLNVFVNVASMRDETRAARYRNRAERLLASVVPRCDELFAFVRREVS